MRAPSFVGKDVISMRDFDRAQTLELLEHCAALEGVEEPILAGKVLGSLFFEPSTRTRLSFEAAMKRFGGQTLGFADVASSSTSKGESLWDTIRVVEHYCDIIVIRHPAEGSARLAAEATERPVLNGGDGSNQHPTQTLLDLFTILKRKGRLDGLKVAFIGDLKYGRTVHSLIRSLSLFECRSWLISPPALGLPSTFRDDLDRDGTEYHEEDSLGAIPRDVDILYVTRIQRERFPDPIEYERVKNAFFVDVDQVSHHSEGVILMHPLPRTNELDPLLDRHPGAAYFEQARNGVTVRKALLALLLGAA